MRRTELKRTYSFELASWMAEKGCNNWPRPTEPRCGNGIWGGSQGGREGRRPSWVNNLPISEEAKELLWQLELQKQLEGRQGIRYPGTIRRPPGGRGWPYDDGRFGCM